MRMSADGSGRPRLADWINEYKLAGREYRVGVTNKSPLVGKTLEEIRLRDVSGANLVAIERGGKLIQPTGKTEMWAGDILYVDLIAPQADVEALWRHYGVGPTPLRASYFPDRSLPPAMARLSPPASSDVVGKTVAGARFRDRYDLSVIGLRRGLAAHERGLRNEELKIGDILLVIGPWKAIRTAQSDGRDLVVLNLPAEFAEVLP